MAKSIFLSTSFAPVRKATALLLTMVTAGCGTFIPSQRDWPNDDTTDVANMNTYLAASVICELSYAVTIAIEKDRGSAKLRPNGRAYSSYLNDWGVEVSTDLTASESSTVNPSGSWSPFLAPAALASISGGFSVGATSSNEDNNNVFYPLSALYKPAYFTVGTQERPCRKLSGDKQGSPLVDIDLKILPLLISRMQTVELGITDEPKKKETITGQKNVLTKTVSIKETFSGGVNPTWAFTTGSINSTGTLFSGSRERTHQIVFTFGELADSRQGLKPLPELTHINQQLKAGLRASVFNR
ncbi:hypothetical protein [Tardiphaga sp. OK245]|uniref:hypothetical protein n=1 Tax=Tardiphaga sp. OK245 TaxID=1855306 RepID=UPI0008A78354|nr:hypothetical protein [Tardiphaga sp. OK245]SEH87176.1 hypothetical protein SAMN05216367_2459 [Tardiphaga sp. OK245]